GYAGTLGFDEEVVFLDGGSNLRELGLPSFSNQTWINVAIEADFANSTYAVFFDGSSVLQASATPITNVTNVGVGLGIGFTTSPDAWKVRFDNMRCDVSAQ